MLTIAYLANEFPSAVEPYVMEEIGELRKRGIRIIAGSVRTPSAGTGDVCAAPDIVLQSAAAGVLVRAIGLCFWKCKRIAPLLMRVAFGGTEGLWQRVKAVIHTVLGACYAATLSGREIDHIHVHHGYFGSWIAMTAASLLDVGFSLTLHGSDLLLNGTYLDVKLARCKFCLTVSEYNRNYILKKYPQLDPRKISVARLGVRISEEHQGAQPDTGAGPLRLLAVGRLHRVKDHAFLVRACAELRRVRRLPFECRVAGDGPERSKLEALIQEHGLGECVRLLGHVGREQLEALYERADVIVLTSRSEGIPLVLMEAMALGKIVLAPAITGIPELITTGQTGFLYDSGSVRDFVAHVSLIHWFRQQEFQRPDPSCPTHSAATYLESIGIRARAQICRNFNLGKNLEAFAELFVERITARAEKTPNENFVLQQI